MVLYDSSVRFYEQQTGRMYCERCSWIIGWQETAIHAGLDVRDPADMTIASVNLNAIVETIWITFLQNTTVLSLVPLDYDGILPDMLHVAVALTENLNLPPESCWMLADIVPFHMLDHPAWALILPHLGRSEREQRQSSLARMAICHHLKYGTSRKNHWLARWYQVVVASRALTDRFPVYTPSQLQRTDGEMSAICSLDEWGLLRDVAARTNSVSSYILEYVAASITPSILLIRQDGDRGDIVLEVANPAVVYGNGA